MEIKKNGDEAAMLFIINREDPISFSPANEIDPDYGQLLYQAEREGVKILPYKCKLNESEVVIDHMVPYKLI